MVFKSFKIVGFLLLIWLGGVSTYAQAVVDTSLTIPAIEITASNIRNESMGFSGRSWDAEEMLKLNAQNVAELLSSESGSYLKSYGLGSIATSSVRGGNAGHTLLLWNGLPLNSPMLAQLDLSLLPIFAAESARFTPGSNTALWGSGAIGVLLTFKITLTFQKKSLYRIKVVSVVLVGFFSKTKFS
ncbi:MAG: Plug domain-containing protein [Saprospiraceae bacterium]|nr:Plug domain-containing protein [Saprospiraceae bacterium]